MNLQSACAWLQNHPLPPPQLHALKNHSRNRKCFAEYKPGFQFPLKSLLPRNGAPLSAVNLNSSSKLRFRVDAVKGSVAFRGKSGSVSFCGLTHESIEERKLESAPFDEKGGSAFWMLAPAAFILLLIVPQIFIFTSIKSEDALFIEILYSLTTEVTFYFGLAQFLRVTESIQKPYLQFNMKSWSLITGLKGYSSFASIAMWLKVFLPVIAALITFPVLGVHVLVSVAPFLAGCLAQYFFERRLQSKGSSCWPGFPIIFEVYRLYQLTRAGNFINAMVIEVASDWAALNAPLKDMFMFSEASKHKNMLIALSRVDYTLRVAGVICLWSLLTFLMRLFPSRPVAETH